MALVDELRDVVRTTTTRTDVEIQAYIDAALEDMRRVGIRKELLDPEDMNPLVKLAIYSFCRGHYGFDNKEAPRFLQSYQWSVTCLMNSAANECQEES